MAGHSRRRGRLQAGTILDIGAAARLSLRNPDAEIIDRPGDTSFPD